MKMKIVFHIRNFSYDDNRLRLVDSLFGSVTPKPMKGSLLGKSGIFWPISDLL